MFRVTSKSQHDASLTTIRHPRDAGPIIFPINPLITTLLQFVSKPLEGVKKNHGKRGNSRVLLPPTGKKFFSLETQSDRHSNMLLGNNMPGTESRGGKNGGAKNCRGCGVLAK